jgi:tetratricopeptide (TPR) repeat protein
MTFEEILDQALDMRRRRGRVTSGALKHQFALDDAYVADLKDAMLYADSHVVDDAGRGLRWTGEPLSTAQRAFEGVGRFYGEAGVLWLVRAFLQHEGRVSYRTLKQVFGFDEAQLADIRAELLFTQCAIDEAGQGLVWRGQASADRAPGETTDARLPVSSTSDSAASPPLASARAAITMATAQRFALVRAAGSILRGWTIAVQEHNTEGLVQIQQGLDMYRSTGAEFQRPHFLTLLAEASGLLGQPEGGLAALEEALILVEKTGERYYEAELHRQRGELLLLREAKSHPAQYRRDQHEAETCFQHALDVARQQQAKSLELRAVMSLARLWQRQGNCAQARALLVEVYDWFTEGFDTADLREAKTLLDTLA